MKKVTPQPRLDPEEHRDNPSYLMGDPHERGGMIVAKHRFVRILLLNVFLLGAFGCAYPISGELRKEVSKGITFPIVLQNPTAYVGKIVLWGGEIIETVNVHGGSEITVLDSPLDYEERPESAQYSRGRFIAKSSEFLDPAIYKKGQKITLAGEIVGKEIKPLGKTEYVYPIVMVKQLHLWERVRHGRYYPYFWYGPYYGPYYGHWGYSPYHWPYKWGIYSDFEDDDLDSGDED
jgi:outer membrane lipoprotein